MHTWIVLFRGVNVGGHGKLPMAALRAALGDAGFGNVKSYIQSGNVTLETDLDPDATGARLADLVEQEFGFRPGLSVIPPAELRRMVDAAPFPGDADPSRCHLFFWLPGKTADPGGPLPDFDDPSEFTLGQGAHYLYTPEGMSNSKLAEWISRKLKTSATARNLRTCRKLLEMSGA